jgi:DNA repair photolyase
MEPGTPPTIRIFDTIRKFIDSGIKCCINIDPIIPFITDGEEHVGSIVDNCQQLGLRYISGSVLRLRHDIWARIKEILELFGISWAIREYERIYGFQEPFFHEKNLSANRTYIDKVVNNLKDEISKRNIAFGFDQLIEQITQLRQGYKISLKQCKMSEFV